MPGCRCWTKLTREPLCLFYNASPIGCTTRERSVRWLLGQDGGTGPEQPFDEAITNRWNFQIFASQPVRRSVIASRDPPDNLFLRRQLRENWSAPDKSYTCCIFSFSFLSFLSSFLIDERLNATLPLWISTRSFVWFPFFAKERKEAIMLSGCNFKQSDYRVFSKRVACLRINPKWFSEIFARTVLQGNNSGTFKM